MKWVALGAVVAAAAYLTHWLRANPKTIPGALVVLGFLPPVLSPLHLYMAGISWPLWPGYVKGVEFSVIDALALALHFALPSRRYALACRLPMVFYLAAVLLSVVHAGVPLAATFYIWQLARMALVYSAVAKACADLGAAKALLRGLAIGLLVQAALAFWQRFGLGILRAGGLFGSTGLGLTTHFAVLPLFALVLARQHGWAGSLGTLAGVVCYALSTSRAGVGIGAFGFMAVFGLSACWRLTSRVALVALMGVGMLALLVPFVVASFEHRYAGEGEVPLGRDDERLAFEEAAREMIADHPWGVGANHYVIVANTGGYNERAGVAPRQESLATNVHNVYLLVLAETGSPGLVTFVVLLLCPVFLAFRYAFRHRGDERAGLLLGLGVGLVAVMLHSFLEWVLVGFHLQYYWAITAGLVAGLAQQLGRRRDGRFTSRLS